MLGGQTIFIKEGPTLPGNAGVSQGVPHAPNTCQGFAGPESPPKNVSRNLRCTGWDLNRGFL